MVSLISVVFLSFIYKELKKKKNPEINISSNSILFIALAYVSWIIVVISKFFDIEEFNLKFIINDRIFSSLSNLFFVLSVIYLPGFRQYVLKRLKISTEKWVIGTFITFALLISLLTVLDKLNSGGQDFISKTIVVLDSLISVSVILLLGLGFHKSFQMLSPNKLFRSLLFIVIIGFSLTQILLPLAKIFPESLSEFYPYFLALFLTFLMAISQIFFLFFSLLSMSNLNQEKHTQTTISNFNYNNEFKLINTIELDFNSEKQNFILRIEGVLEDDELKKIEIESNKITQPILYWYLFSLAKNRNAKLYHSDMAILKFRMVEYWNKKSSIRINQDVLFLNDNSRFEFSAKNVVISNALLENFLTKHTVKELIKKHYLSFLDDRVVKENNLYNKKNFESYCESNFESFYLDLSNNIA